MKITDVLDRTKASLKGKWIPAVLTFFIYGLVEGAISVIPAAGPIIILIIGGPLLYGINVYSLSLVRGQEARMEMIFDGFRHFERTVIAYLLMCIAIIIGFFLLIIPGIILAIAFSMAYFILIDEPQISGQDALRKSMKMMNGYKMKYFVMSLWFLFLGICCIFTLGIGFFFLLPYMYVAYAEFYEEVKSNYVEAQ